MTDIDCTVIGAGVIGLAVARALASAGYTTLILEREVTFGTITSARSSEVIHAGLYYPTGSLKALLCVRGKALLYEFCESHAVAHRRCGKLIVATDPAQLDALQQLMATAQQNGVNDLQWLSAEQARALEPELRCCAALLSPSTGILDTHAYMLALLGDAERHGGLLATHSTAIHIEAGKEYCSVTTDERESTTLRSQWVINCAGLDAPALAGRIENFPQTKIPKAQFAKGTYFNLLGRSPFSRLIYPLPEPGGLGVHVTLDLGGNARFGPDVEWLSIDNSTDIDYRVDITRAGKFHDAIRRYWPHLRDDQLAPAYAGVRPKITGPDELAADFRIDGPAEHGVPGIVNLFGIESPGITASLAIAEYVLRMVRTA